MDPAHNTIVMIIDIHIFISEIDCAATLETNFQPIGTVSIPTRTDIDLDTVED
jgi:hypothetical protein